jgi:hypothetical protein
LNWIDNGHGFADHIQKSRKHYFILRPDPDLDDLDPGLPRTTVDAVAFNRAATAASPAHRELLDGPVDIAFHIRKNVFNGSEKLELNVLDYNAKPVSEDLILKNVYHQVIKF